MFGYNMERLGFGHRMVHTSAFMIVLVGPMLVFAASAHAMRHIGVPIFGGLLRWDCGGNPGAGVRWTLENEDEERLPLSREASPAAGARI